MKEKHELMDELIEKGQKYGLTSLHLLKLRTLDKAADVLSNVVSWLPLLVAVTLFILILNIAIAIWLGDILGKMYYGFFIVAGFYAIFTLLCFFFRKSMLKYPLNNLIINEVLKGEEDEQ